VNIETIKTLDGQEVYRCSCCGKEFKQLPFCIGAEFPDYYFSVPEEEIENRVHFTKDLCVIDDEYFFIRGRINIPIIDYPESFAFNIWTTLSESSFMRVQELWNNPERVNEPPYFGWLNTKIPTYNCSENIKTNVHTTSLEFIPEIKIIEENHQLKVDQDNGITLQKAFEILEVVMPGFHNKEE